MSSNVNIVPSHFPEEIAQEIWGYFNFKDLNVLSRVNKALKKQANVQWKQIAKKIGCQIDSEVDSASKSIGKFIDHLKNSFKLFKKSLPEKIEKIVNGRILSVSEILILKETLAQAMQDLEKVWNHLSATIHVPSGFPSDRDFAKINNRFPQWWKKNKEKLSQPTLLYIHNDSGLHYLPSKIWKSNAFLVLDLSGNELEHFPKRIELKETLKLDLSENKFQYLSPGIGKLVSLEMLNLSGNRMIKLPEEITDLVQLRNLNLKGNRLTKLPKFRFEMLETLNLANNLLSDLSDKFENMFNLHVLNLKGNKLEELPKELSSLRSLRVLNLQNNNFTSFPEVLTSIDNLCRLNLANNSISNLPDEMGNLVHLQRLNLADNELQELPKKFTALEKLELLDIQNNKFPTEDKLREHLPRQRFKLFFGGNPFHK